MDCPKCGYERQPKETHCTLCGLDFEYYENLQAENKALKEKNTQSSGMEEEEAYSEQPVPAKLARETYGSKCPKCGYGRKETATDCPKCGVVYEKHEALTAQKESEIKSAKETEARRIQEEKARKRKEAEEAIAREREKRASFINEKKENEPAIKKIVLNIKNVKMIGVGIVLILVIVIAGVVISKQITAHKAEKAFKEEIARRDQLDRIKTEELKKRIDYFQANKNEIIDSIKTLINQKQLEAAETEIKKYEAASFENELTGVKNDLTEIKLQEQAKTLSANDYEGNSKTFTELSRINPSNKVYGQKAEYYEAKYKEEKAEENYRVAMNYFQMKDPERSDLTASLKAIDEAIKLGKKKEIYRDLKYKLEEATLQFYEGNDNVQMMIRNDGISPKGTYAGQRKLYVGIKNVGSTSFYVNVEFFTLIGVNEKNYSYNAFSNGLAKSLNPGQEAKGYIYFYTNTKPKKLIFSHVNAGTISRAFP